MSDQNIFGENQNPATQPQNNGAPGNGAPTPQSDQLGNLLGMIKNERGEQKYKTVEEALNALAHSQAYIPQLKAELDATKNSLSEAEAAKAKIQELEQTVLRLTQNNTPNVDQPVGLSEEDIAALVTKTLQRNQEAAIQKQNLDSVVNKVREVHGEKAAEFFYGKAKELGLSQEQINSLAASSPQAALSLLGVGTANIPNRSAPNTSINTSAFQPRQDTFVTVNTEGVMGGATTHQIRQESDKARKMVEELHSAGMSTYDLTDPKVYRKYFYKG